MRAPILAALAVLIAAGPASAASKAQRKLAHQVEQAMLYVNMKLPERAREELDRLVKTEPGKSDALTWLALSRAHFALKDLDEAGAAFNRAEGLGAEKVAASKGWSKSYYKDFKERVGGVRIRDATCDNVKFRARLAAPMVNREKRALLEALDGWRKKELERRTDRAFYLPAGKYKLGETKVKIIPGQETSITAKEAGAECTALPTPVATGPATTGGGQTSGGAVTGTAPPPKKGDSNFFADNWYWLAIGAAVLAGGAAGVAVATQDSGPKKFFYEF